MHRPLPVAFVVQDDERLREGALMDLSDTGARLRGPVLPPDDMVVALRFRSPRIGPIVAARVIRRVGEDVWIEIVSAQPDVLEFWHGLVAIQET